MGEERGHSTMAWTVGLGMVLIAALAALAAALVWRSRRNRALAEGAFPDEHE
jgi:hypothetical protein